MNIKKSDFVKAKVSKSIYPGKMPKTVRELHEMSQKDLSEATKLLATQM